MASNANANRGSSGSSPSQKAASASSTSEQKAGQLTAECGNAPSFQKEEAKEAKRTSYVLPMEPTESVERGREYPPIVTVDGKVDTDIDHLMESPEERDDFIETPLQDVPSKFPKPKVVRVIEGSLDEDIDNLMNYDGTMAHSLVDTLPQVKRGDLKEINSKTSDNKPTYPTRSTRTFGDLRADDSDNEASTTEVVPFSERNNSSNEVLMDVTLPKVVESDEEEGGGDGGEMAAPNGEPDVGQGDQGEKELAAAYDDGLGYSEESKEEKQQIPDTAVPVPDKSANSESQKIIVDYSDTSQDPIKSENSPQAMSYQPHEVNQILQELLDNVRKQHPQEIFGLGNQFGQQTDKCLKKTTSLQTFEDLRARTHKIKHAPTKQHMNTLPQNLDIVKRALQTMTLSGSDSETESQRALTVTALKVAGESMTAAAKLADALTQLVKASPLTGSSDNPLSRLIGENNDCMSSLKRRDTHDELIVLSHTDSFLGTSPIKTDEDSLLSRRVINNATSESVDKRKKESHHARGGRPNENEDVDSHDPKSYRERKRESRHRRESSQGKDTRTTRKHSETTSRSEHKSLRKHTHYDDDDYVRSEREKSKEGRKHRKSGKDLESYHGDEKPRSRRRKEDIVEGDISKREPRHRSAKEKRTKSGSRRRLTVGIDESPRYEGKINGNVGEVTPEKGRESGMDATCGQWELPQKDPAEKDLYFNQVVRRLKSLSPTFDTFSPACNQQIRAKLVGSCVDPYGRDSDFDSIEYNGNAQLSDARLAHFVDEMDQWDKDGRTIAWLATGNNGGQI